MATLVYSPQIEVKVETANGTTYDLSEDLVNWQLNLRENAPHTFGCTLQNTQRKYDGILLPMDKVSVRLKRLNWLQSFTGYLNEVPIFQAWPGTVTINATCTLKIPQFFYWDPTTTEAQNMIMSALNPNTTKNDKGQTVDKSVQGDFGIRTLIQDSLEKVLHWDKTRIHIGEIPNKWWDWAKTVSTAIGVDEALYAQIGASATAAGTYGADVNNNLPAGGYADVTVTPVMAKNASLIWAVLDQLNAPDDVRVMTYMCAIDESHLTNHASPTVPGSLALPHDDVQSPNADSVGVFQQQYTQGWGTVAQCQDVQHAAHTFITRLMSSLGHTTAPYGISTGMYGVSIQNVQGSYDNTGSNYQRYLTAAQAIVAKLKATGSAIGSTTPKVGEGNNVALPDPTKGFKASGGQIAKVAMDLIDAHKNSPIIYNEGGDDPADTPVGNVRTLDCSSLVDWVYYHATGQWLSGTRGQRTVVSSIIPLCTQVDLKAAYSIQGAIFTVGDHHVGVSLGNGSTHVAAHDKYSNPVLDVNISPIEPGNGFDRAWLLPGIDYSQAGTTQGAMDAISAAGQKATGLGGQLTDVNDPSLANTSTGGSPFLNLLNNIVTSELPGGTIGETLGGTLALINDEPFLPWLQTLVNGTMRSFCSAPNGDFIAWFPDYLGIWGTAGKINIELIELQDFTVTWSDQNIVTHQFVLGNPGVSVFDIPSAGIGYGPDAVTDLLSLARSTAGIASFDYPEIFKLIYGETAPHGYIQSFLARFGARPDVQQTPLVHRGQSEFFLALYLFVQRWAAQFTATVPLTFMPEVFPGMLLKIPEYGFQAYVQGVSHTGSYGQGGSFQTQVQICAPSNLAKSDRTDLLSLLPLGTDIVDSVAAGGENTSKKKKTTKKRKHG